MEIRELINMGKIKSFQIVGKQQTLKKIKFGIIPLRESRRHKWD